MPLVSQTAIISTSVGNGENDVSLSVDMAAELGAARLEGFDAARFWAAARNADKTNASPAALAELRAVLAEYPDAWRIVGDLGRIARGGMLAQLDAPPSLIESVRAGLDRLRDELGGETQNAVEALAIDACLTAWLDQQLTTTRFSQNQANGLALEAAEHWQRRLSLTQRRYLRALETLSRIRKLNINIQINVADQQVNVNGSQ
jgi:hypothetical protein